MKNRLKKIMIAIFLSLFLFGLLKTDVVFAEQGVEVTESGFKAYIAKKQDGIIENGKCTNKCEDWNKTEYYQLSFGIPLIGFNKCDCVKVKDSPAIFAMVILKFLLASIGTLATILVIFAGFKWSFSAGNANSIKQAKEMLKNAAIGLVLVIFSGSILALINPNLLKIMSVNINNIGYICVDDAKIKTSHDTTKKGVFVDEKGVAWNKNCNTICDKDGGCLMVSGNAECVCKKSGVDNNGCGGEGCGSSRYCYTKDGKPPTGSPNSITGKCLEKVAKGDPCTAGKWSCITGYCNTTNVCGEPTKGTTGAATCGDDECWEYKKDIDSHKKGDTFCIKGSCSLEGSGCDNPYFSCNAITGMGICVPSDVYCSGVNSSIVRCGESTCTN